MVTNEERVQRYARAIYDDQIVSYDPDEVAEVTEAVMAVADAEQAELRAWLTDARAALRNMDRLLTEVNADADRMEAAEAKVARVGAATNAPSSHAEWCHSHSECCGRECDCHVLAFRAALDGDA